MSDEARLNVHLVVVEGVKGNLRKIGVVERTEDTLQLHLDVPVEAAGDDLRDAVLQGHE